jgi:hypothetical protein
VSYQKQLILLDTYSFFVCKNNDIMNIDTCSKYFDFLNTQCDRYLKDNKIEEEEIHQLKIEFDRFLQEAKTSKLPLELKNKISDLSLEYVYQPRREYGELLGYWNLGKHRRQRKMKETVKNFKNQIKDVSIYLKENY